MRLCTLGKVSLRPVSSRPLPHGHLLKTLETTADWRGVIQELERAPIAVLEFMEPDRSKLQGAGNSRHVEPGWLIAGARASRLAKLAEATGKACGWYLNSRLILGYCQFCS